MDELPTPEAADPDGSFWVLPGDWIDSDLEAGRLPALKGATPTELPTLEGQVTA